ncbi:MAG: penicillin acylase family protein, partial [Propionibacteriales bacterium]|nr:penicillin acylase family protein [Propionibacteriales bacterium]
MHRWVRVVSLIGVVVGVALVLSLLAGIWTVRRSYPQTDGELTVAGLSGDVEVVRDSYGVPQIYADTAEDLFRAQGFVQAQDRLFEMDFRRHVTAGRLSELFGEDTVDTDRFIRTLGWREVAEREVALLDADSRRYLEAFSAGVNSYLEDRSPTRLSLEYAVLALDGLDYAPEPWSPADSLAWMKAMAWDLRGNMQDEIDRVLATEVLSTDQIAELYPGYPYKRHRPIVAKGAVVDGVFEQEATANTSRRPRRAALSDRVVAALRGVDRAAADLPTLLGTGHGIGSNSWVVSSQRTNTGAPMLVNDPHLSPTMPGIWYQMGLHCRTVTESCPFDVSGFTFSGVPGVVIGHNDSIAWGMTNLGPDVVDLYIEDVDDQAGTYRYGNGAEELVTREETIEVRDGEDVTIEVRSTRHGPLISDADEELSEVGDRGGRVAGGNAVALRWTALDPGGTANAIFDLDTARSWEDFRSAAQQFLVPSQNLVYADVEGHIGYQAPGEIPIRRTGNGDWPVPGWDPAYEWAEEYIPFDALPHVLDPEEGFIATANQAVVGSGYPYYLGSSWSYGHRSQRIADLLANDRSLTVDDMAKIQLDSRNGNAERLVPYLLDVNLD